MKNLSGIILQKPTAIMFCNKQAHIALLPRTTCTAKCEKCGRWGHPFDMDYDDDTGFICEAARDECDKIMNKNTKIAKKKKIKLIKPKEEEIIQNA